MGIDDIFRRAQEDADVFHNEVDEDEDAMSFCVGCHQDWPCDFARDTGQV